MRRKMIILTSAAAATGIAAALLRRKAQPDLSGKVVLITGGSRGLGLALARGFAARGASLALCARSDEELQSAKRDLEQFGAETLTLVCDVSHREQVEHMVDATLRHFGRLDVLVNNAGLIRVGPIHTMTIEDFENAMDVMFWGTVYSTLAVLPHMRSRGAGRIVNITSVGAKVSVPHLVPYSCAKFAAAAFSEGMRSELSGTGVKVVTIAPGLMRTGSYLNAVFKGAEEGEAVWFSAGASIPGISISAKRAARQIIEATVSGSPERILSTPANLLARFHGLFPGVTVDLLGLVNRLLPSGSREVERGAESPALKTVWARALTTLGRRAAKQYLQPAAAASGGPQR
ncbi:MAG: SDR family oxidoreductase [Bryobacteraceae bacterium]